MQLEAESSEHVTIRGGAARVSRSQNRSSTRKDKYDRSHSQSNNTICPTMIIAPDDQASKRPSESKVQPEELQVGHEEVCYPSRTSCLD